LSCACTRCQPRGQSSRCGVARITLLRQVRVQIVIVQVLVVVGVP
jgi:hypothetical protein